MAEPDRRFLGTAASAATSAQDFHCKPPPIRMGRAGGVCQRFRNRLHGLNDKRMVRPIELEEETDRIRVWVAHAVHANTWRLRSAIFGADR